MRNAFVVLVSLCIGLASGFIAPSGDSKKTLKNNTNIEDVHIKKSLNQSVELTPAKELPENRTGIDENALYEYAVAKTNNQSERAFIYINQKYKKPSLHQYFKLSQSGPEFSRSFHLPPAIPQAKIQRLNEPCKSEHNIPKSYFQEFNAIDRSPDVSSYFATTHLYNCNDEQVKAETRHHSQIIDQSFRNHDTKISNRKRDYVELFKTPLLRSVESIDVKAKHDGIPGPHFSPLYYKDFVKNKLRKQHNRKANILVDERKNEYLKNYGFSPPYIIDPAYRNKGLQRLEDANVDEDANEDETSRIFQNNQEEDKLLSQYIQETLEDQVTSNEKVAHDCNTRDCNSLPTKTSSREGEHKYRRKPDCPCRPQYMSNSIEPQVAKERLEREEAKTKFEPKPSDITYYEKILTEDTSNQRIKHYLNQISDQNDVLNP